MSIELKGNDESTFDNDVTIETGKLAVSSDEGTDYVGRFTNTGTRAYGLLATFPNSTNSTSTFFKGKVGDDDRVVILADGSASFNGAASFGLDKTGSQSVIKVEDSGSENRTIDLKKDGSATFNGDLQITQNASTEKTIQVGTISTPGKVSIRSNGNAYFAGEVTQGNTLLNLDTGGVLDVKERIQNTQAILYRLKAALIQPDADVNTLRQRLLEALDILTSDGDES